MKQPMSKNEIAVWDAVATRTMQASVKPIFKDGTCKTVTFLESSEAYSYATRAITARRAALIADAHVGEHAGESGEFWWICRCESNHDVDMETSYCERCHTRRPEEDKAKHDHRDGHACINCKHEPTPYTESPCQECDFNSRWEAAP